MGNTVIIDRIKKCWSYDTKAGQVGACKVVLKDNETGKKTEAIIQYPPVKNGQNVNSLPSNFHSFSVASSRCDPEKDKKCPSRLADLL